MTCNASGIQRGEGKGGRYVTLIVTPAARFKNGLFKGRVRSARLFLIRSLKEKREDVKERKDEE